jgi:hypothetical protein
LPPLKRFIEARRMRATRAIQAAIKYREKEDARNSLRCAVLAFRYWPSPFYGKTFKVLLLELRRYLGSRAKRTAAG